MPARPLGRAEQGEAGDAHPADGDPAQAGSLAAPADRVDVKAEAGEVKCDGADERDRGEQDQSCIGIPAGRAVPSWLNASMFGYRAVEADRRGIRHQQRGSTEHTQRAERDDEARHFEDGDECPVDDTARGPSKDASGDGDDEVDVVLQQHSDDHA